MAFDNIQGQQVPPKELDIRLIIEGVSYTNFETMTINRQLNTLANSFDFSISQPWGDNKIDQFDVYMGASAIVSVNGQSIINGYIEDLPVEYDTDGFDVGYSGRDVTGDLIDCSVDIDVNKNEYLEQTASSILTRICSPFGISVQFEDTAASIDMGSLSTPVADFKINIGAKAIDVIKDICQRYGVLAYSKGDGKLTITRAGALETTDSLQGGVNILGVKLKQSNRKRFSHYYIKGTTPQSTAFTKPADLNALVRDDVITRNRPLIIVDGDVKTKEDCETKVAWFARLAAGQSRTPVVIVQGWLQSNGDIWPLNALVHYKDEFLGFDETMLIAGAKHTLDSTSGTLTALSLVFPETFEKRKRSPIKKIKSIFDGKKPISNVKKPLPDNWRNSTRSAGSFPSNT